MKVLLTLVLALLLAGCAAERGDGAGSATTQEGPTANAKEETTVYTEETTVLATPEPPDFLEPPDSTLSYGGREVKGTPGSFCWSSGNAFGCADASWPIMPSKQKTLTVPPDSEMVFRYGGQDPPKTVEARAYALKKLQEKDATMRPEDTLTAHGSGVQKTIPAKLPSGKYVLEMSVGVNEEAGADYYFLPMIPSSSAKMNISSTLSRTSRAASRGPSLTTAARLRQRP